MKPVKSLIVLVLLLMVIGGNKPAKADAKPELFTFDAGCTGYGVYHEPTAGWHRQLYILAGETEFPPVINTRADLEAIPFVLAGGWLGDDWTSFSGDWSFTNPLAVSQWVWSGACISQFDENWVPRFVECRYQYLMCPATALPQVLK